MEILIRSNMHLFLIFKFYLKFLDYGLADFLKSREHSKVFGQQEVFYFKA
jgi:hypothetical protein